MNFHGVSEMLAKYQVWATVGNIDALGYYVVPLAYSQMQVLEQAVNATGNLNDEVLSEYCQTNYFETVIGKVEFGEAVANIAQQFLEAALLDEVQIMIFSSTNKILFINLVSIVGGR